jgi:uncharacterized protein YndB with AHSA1/START domain
MAKVQVQFEFIIHASAHTIYNCISTPSGFEEWFADKVNIKGDELTFIWEGEQKVAKLVSSKKDQFVKFHWVEDGKEKTFFEIRLTKDEMTGDLALIITDFCDEGEEDECLLLWESSVENLKHAVGG